MDLTNFEKVSGMSILRRREQLRRVGGCIRDYCITLPGIAGVSPAPRVADKIGREARQISWIRPICRACHLPKLRCGIIPPRIGKAKPTSGRLPTAPASVNAKERFISYSSQGGGGGKADKADIFVKISWNPPPDSPLTPRFPSHDPKSGTHTNSLPAPQNEIVPSS